jgi:TolA protein
LKKEATPQEKEKPVKKEDKTAKNESQPQEKEKPIKKEDKATSEAEKANDAEADREKQFQDKMRDIKKAAAINKMKRAKDAGDVSATTKGELDGTGGQPDAGEMNKYFAEVTDLIWREWAYPDSERSDLVNRVSLKIAPDGRILAVKLEASSGDNVFDKSTLNAVRKVGKLPPPPFDKDEEIEIRFKL